MKNVLTIASDGSCLKNPGGAMGWAWADSQGRWMRNGAPVGTNNQAELLGLISIFFAFPNTHLRLELDSQYTLNIADKWMWGWAAKGWKKKDGEIKNLDYVRLIHALSIRRKEARLMTEFNWVKGHQTKEPESLNNIVDLRAGESSALARELGTVSGTYLDSTGGLVSAKQNKILELLKITD